MLRHRIVYLAAFAASLVVFVGTNAPAALGVLLFLAILFAASATVCAMAAARTELEFRAMPACEVGQPHSLTITARRRFPVPSGRIVGTVRFRNLLLGEERPVSVMLDASAAHEARFDLPLDADTCGRVEFAVEDVWLQDPLGLVSRPVRGAFSGTYTVYPRVIDLTVPLERSPRATFSGMTYDPRRRGQDMSEPFDIRDYRQTDPVHAIHWKLSMKTDKLLVREASHPSNYDVLLVVDAGLHFADGTPVPRDVTTAILEMAVSVSYELCRQNLGHNVAFPEGDRLADVMVDTTASFGDMLDMLVGTPLPATMGVDVAVFDAYRREHSFTKTVVVTGAVNDAAFAVVGTMTDLSVVDVAASGAKAVGDAVAFGLTSVPVEDVGARVKSVVI